jgi:hypothetical protein
MTMETLKQKLHEQDIERDELLGDFSECSDEE